MSGGAYADGSGDGVVDAAQRARALDVTRSFVVQAPAGSGKTGLLVLRFLALLARVERPEAVLAITFTRKAAGEMRRRIVEALRHAAECEEAPEKDFERERYELARAVLARDADKDWGLLHSPSRLQVFTIDGFCSRVAAATPLLSRLGSTPAVVDDAGPLYREAVRRTLSAEGRELLSAEFGILLERYEMGLERLETQLLEMLSRRDQWSEAFFDRRHDEDQWVDEVEAAFEQAVAAEVTSMAAGVDPGLLERIHAIARRSREAAPAEQWPSLGDADLLGVGAAAASATSAASAAWAWKQASALLLKGGKPRTRRGRHQDVFGADAALKEDFHDLLDDLGEMDELEAARWLEGLRAAAKLPGSPRFSPGGREAVGAFLAVLRQSYLALWEVFRERRQVDHVEIAMRAVAALAPGETLEKLDARLDHVLVDEFQDTNVLQCNLLRGLTRGWQGDDARTLFLVGDPMQSIYRFRKAEVGLFLAARSSPRFLSSVALEPLTLSVNFRSTRSVIGWVNRSFRVLLGDRDDATRSLVAFAPADPGPEAAEGVAVETVRWQSTVPCKGAEADAVEAAGLADLISAECRSLRDGAGDGDGEGRSGPAPVAVLVRARNHALPLLRALESRAPELRVRAPGLDKLAHRTVVVDLEALTRALLHPGDRLSWLAVLRSPWVGLTLDELSRLVETDVATALRDERRATPVPLLLRDEGALAALDEPARARIRRWLDVADTARMELARRPLDLVVRSAWLRLGGLVATGQAARLEGLDADAFFELLAARVENGSVNLEDLARSLASTDAAVDDQAEADVEIMTMHKAKGLEFDTVILPALANGAGGAANLPLAMETEPDSGLLTLVAPRGARGREDSDQDKYAFLRFREGRREEAETLRVLYVAATRARRRLVLSLAEGRLNKDGSPPARSLLGALAPAVDLEGASTVVVEEAAATPPSAKLRFPNAYVLAQVPPSIRDRAVATESPSELELAPDHFSEDKTAAHVGTVFHDFAERIALEGLEAWPPARLAQEKTRVAHALRRAGMTGEVMAEAVDRVTEALRGMLEDQKGRWILGVHEDARSEWALTALRDGRLVSAKIDRAFVADGRRWVVDFKTGRWPGSQGQEAEVYVQEKCDQYWPQLARYRDLVGEVDQAAPVGLALYFAEWPAERRWQDVTKRVGALESGAGERGDDS